MGPLMTNKDLVQHALVLLNQQIWCWGCDILRLEGNWLLEVGFTRIEPPADRDSSSSVYSLGLPNGRSIVLRGFGVFYGDHRYGGIFLPRFEFNPRYTKEATLQRPPWSDSDLRGLKLPKNSQRTACANLTLDLFDWIRSYEVEVAERLGIEYRNASLEKWDNGDRKVIPGEEMAREWRLLNVAMAEHWPL